MQRRDVLKGLGVALGATWVSSSNAAEPDNDLQQIRGAVFDYFEGYNEVSRERLERAFHSGAEMKSVAEDGTLSAQPIETMIERWLQAEPRSRRGRILAIDVAERSIARVVFDFDGAYTDFLTLARIQGQWKIIDKVFIKH